MLSTVPKRKFSKPPWEDYALTCFLVSTTALFAQIFLQQPSHIKLPPFHTARNILRNIGHCTKLNDR